MQTNDRIERFKAEAADLNLKTGGADKEQRLLGFGVLLMVVGVVLAFVSYAGGTGAPTTGDVVEFVILGLAAVSLVVTGGTLFLRYSLAKFLRFWLLRQLYEGQAHIDQVVDAIKQR